MTRTTNLQMLVLVCQGAQNLPRTIRRHVIDGVDVVAELRDVPDGLLYEQILVTDENDANDLRIDVGRC